VTGTGNGGVVDGEAFDLVIPVEIEMPGGNGGQVRKLEIGYNQGQNPFQVAQAFIDKHFLDQNYLPTIFLNVQVIILLHFFKMQVLHQLPVRQRQRRR
jgi:hypothetical protein